MALSHKQRIIAAVALPLGLAALGGGGLWWADARHYESTDNAYVEADTAVISPRVEGYIAAIQVRDNQPVRAGDVLLTIDDRDFRARVAQAEARVSAAQAAIDNTESRLLLERSLIEKAEAGLASSAAEKQRALGDRQRYEALARSDFASQQRVAVARADAAKADAATEAARAALEAERRQVTVLETERAQQRAALSEAAAALELARSDLDKTVIRAPIDGIVGNSGARLGQLVRPGTQVLSVVPVGDVYVTANYKETQVADIRPGQRALLTVDAFPGLQVEGRVESLAPASGSEFSLLPPENATGNFTKIVQRVPVRIALPAELRSRGWLRPGLSVEVKVDRRGTSAETQVAGN
jgi:membrane fusion protein (multidrug efflux system)